MKQWERSTAHVCSPVPSTYADKKPCHWVEEPPPIRLAGREEEGTKQHEEKEQQQEEQRPDTAPADALAGAAHNTEEKIQEASVFVAAANLEEDTEDAGAFVAVAAAAQVNRARTGELAVAAVKEEGTEECGRKETKAAGTLEAAGHALGADEEAAMPVENLTLLL